MPERKAWLQYRETLYRVADGVSTNDSACIELAIRYIELRHIGSYSGFVRQLMSRRLKHVNLSPQQQIRLHQHFSNLVLGGEHTQEYRDYFKLWRLFITEKQKMELLRDVAPKGEKAVQWLAEKLQPNKSLQPMSALTRRRV